MNPLKYFRWVVLITGGLFLLPALIVIFYDPFFIYHRPFLNKDVGFDDYERYQNAGLINSWLADPAQKIDTIIVGTSMSGNFQGADYLNDAGAPALKLAYDGGHARETTAIILKALSTGRVNTVVWEIFKFHRDLDPLAVHKDSPLPFYLYNETLWDDWRYVFNNDVLEDASKLAINKISKRRTMEQLYTWEDEEGFESFSSPSGLNKIKENLKAVDFPLRSDDSLLDYDFPNIDQHVLPVLKAYPEVSFKLFFPPVSYIYYAGLGHAEYHREMNMRAYLIEKTANLKNVEIYGFDLKPGIGDTLANYRDPNHYSAWVNKFILDEIKAGRHRVVAKTWDSYEARLRQRVNRAAGL